MVDSHIEKMSMESEKQENKIALIQEQSWLMLLEHTLKMKRLEMLLKIAETEARGRGMTDEE